MSNTFFSILVPVYNSEDYMDACIQSALNQTYKDFELVLVDDGSTDKSGSVCDRYAAEDSRIKVFHKENEGPLLTREYAIEHASGKYLLFLDSDDSIMPYALETLKKEIESDTGIDCVLFGLQMLTDGKTVRINQEKQRAVFEEKYSLMKKLFAYNLYNSLCIKCIRRELAAGKSMAEYGRLYMGEDLLQSLIILKDCKKASFIPDILYNYTLHSDSLTRNKNRFQIVPFFEIREKCLDIFTGNDLLNDEGLATFFSCIVKYIASYVVDITLSNLSKEDKESKYEEIRNHPFYAEHLNDVDCPGDVPFIKRRIYSLFKKNKYGAMHRIGRLLRR